MKNKKLIIIIVAIVLLIAIGVGVWYFFIREERKFENLDELSLAIQNDVKYVKDMIY